MSSKESISDFKKRYFESLLKEQEERLLKHREQIQDFQKRMALHGISLSTENFQYQQTIGLMAVYPGITNYLLSDILADKDGLFSFEELRRNLPTPAFHYGCLSAGNFMLLAHPHFRRSFHDENHFAPKFIELFWALNNPDIESFISLDPDRVRINMDNRFCVELDTWYGARFNKDVKTIPDGITKLRPPLDIDEDLISFFFRDAYALDTKWSTKNGIKTFQAEELKAETVKLTVNGTDYHPVRYVHAEYEIDKGYFRHFDGAIHFYTEQEYYMRRDSDFNYNAKSSAHIKTLSRKLFKMNGVVSTDVFAEFTSHFMAGNPLAIEYLEGKYPLNIQQMLELARTEYQ